MVTFPKPFSPGDSIAVTAPSSGVEKELHYWIKQARQHEW